MSSEKRRNRSGMSSEKEEEQAGRFHEYGVW